MKNLLSFSLILLSFTQTAFSQVLLSEVYGGGGNAGAAFTRDFIEITNYGSSSVDISGWSVQYASATSTTAAWSVTAIPPSTILAPGATFLVCEASGGAVGATISTCGITGTINMSATAGKVILANNTTAFNVQCPTTGVDFIPFGTTANCTPKAPAGTNSNSISRATAAGDPTTWTAGAPLPVVLVKFSALSSQNNINLAFTTASEKNNDFFAIERSNDGKNFRQIGEVKGNGNSTTIQNYTFTDLTPANGRNFYRLKQVDFDGKFDYSEVRMVSFGRNNGIQLAPTQVEESMKITLDKALEADATWEITNIEGRIVKSGTINAETTTQNIETYDLQSGQYFVRLLDNNQPLIAKFVKM
jgi:Lamin Tail Domain/Secretion system C-terminal sorting domain